MQVACGVYKKCNPSSGIDQLQNCLIAAWKDTAKQQKWQEKTVSTTFQSLTEQSDNTEKLSQIISETIKQLTKEDIECFELNFIRQLSKNSNQEAYKSFMAQLQVENNRLLKSREKIDKSSVNPDYILTPKVSCWKNEYLKDIEDFVKNLCQELQNNKPHICLTGMGGIGKSEILKRIYAEFANNTIKEHPFKHLALLHYDDTLSSSIIKDVTGLGDKRADDAWTYMTNLCNNEHTLLLIDDTRKKIESKTPDDSFEKLFALNATVLLASRKQVHKKFTTHTVDPLKTETCIEIFKENNHKHIHFPLEPEDMNLLTAIIEKRVGCHPLIVRRISAMAHEGNYNIVELSGELEKRGFVIRKGAEDEGTLQEEINKLYPFGAVQKVSEKNLLEAFALFPSDRILDLVLCVKWLCKDANIVESDCRFDLKKLADSTWLMEAGNGYAMHQLVQTAVITQSESMQFSGHCNLMECLLDAVSFGERDTFRKAAPYIDYAVSLASFWSEKHVEDVSFAGLMSWIGRYYDDIAVYSEALEWYFKALAISEKVLGKEHPSTATTYNNIALVYDNQGKFEEALKWCMKALAIMEKVLGTEHPYTAATYNDIALVYAHQGNYPKAIELYEKALVICEKVLGKDHPNTVTIYNNIACIYNNQRD